ncbi:hypothetical protein FB451DRAFT_1369931 [Mycena latifolia]|nr:hypothetical protein FB451DRAFT_1369931 [Mycena latifolia]
MRKPEGKLSPRVHAVTCIGARGMGGERCLGEKMSVGTLELVYELTSNWNAHDPLAARGPAPSDESSEGMNVLRTWEHWIELERALEMPCDSLRDRLVRACGALSSVLKDDTSGDRKKSAQLPYRPDAPDASRRCHTRQRNSLFLISKNPSIQFLISEVAVKNRAESGDAHLLNEPLTDSEALRVKFALYDTLSALSALNAGPPKGLLDKSLSPIRRISSEILAEIFLLCRESSLRDADYSVADPRHAPTVSTHVSSRWRESFVSLSALLPWSQLTRLNLQIPLDLSEVTGFFVPMRDVTGEFGGVDTYEKPRPSQRVYKLNHLHRLKIRAHNEQIPDTFFAAFAFPNLLDLIIENAELSPHALPDLYDRSKFSLAHFRLSLVDLSADGLDLFLRQLPTLRQLALSYSCTQDAFFRAFTYDPRQPVPPFALPLTLEDDSDDVEGILIAGMWGQNGAFPTLVEVHLSLRGPRFAADIEARLAAGCATGLVKDYCARETHNSYSSVFSWA